MSKFISVKLLLSLLITLFVTEQSPTPQQIADELLAADRAFASAAAKTDLIGGLSAMFANDVAMPAPGGLAYGSDKAIDALRSNPANTGAKVQWLPGRVGLSADGKHGFTAGFMSITRADGTISPGKYLAYWEKRAEGWRVIAYKRGFAKTTPTSFTPTYLLPKQITSVSGPAKESDRESLAASERSFSKDAQTMGLGDAFKKYGSADAINLGGPDTPTFLFGNEAIGTSVGAGSPTNSSPLSWGPEKTIIAASGDFGITIGYITSNGPRPDGKTPPPQPFMTIWRRDSPSAPWRYIAE